MDREARIAAYRQRQPLAELERKWNKARGRHSNRYWIQEWVDLADARGREMARIIEKLAANQTPLGAEFERVWDENSDALHES